MISHKISNELTVEAIRDINIHLSWICQEMCIEPAILVKDTDVTPAGYIEMQYRHFSDVNGNNFAQDLEMLLDESFRHAEVYVSAMEEGKWFNLNISFKYDSFKHNGEQE